MSVIEAMTTKYFIATVVLGITCALFTGELTWAESRQAPLWVVSDIVNTDSYPWIGEAQKKSDLGITDDTAVTISIELARGWNQISLPLVLDEEVTVAQALTSIEGSYDRVLAFDGCDPADPWKLHDPSVPDFVNDLDNVDNTMGLWVKMKVADTLIISGAQPARVEIPLCAGWNLIGYPSIENRPVAGVLEPIAGQYERVETFDAGDPTDPWKVYDPGVPAFVNDLTEFWPGLGYAVLISEDTTLVFDSTRRIIFDGERAYEHAWAQCDFGPRPPGSEALRRAGDDIIEQLEAQNWTVEEQTFDHKGVTVRNLIGRKGEGTPIVIGAHYDTRARADQDPNLERRDDPVPGGNDGASGVAVLLELARSLEVQYTGHEIWLAFFDAEDNGSGGLPGWGWEDWIVGSSYMAEHLATDVDFMILLDMIGDQDQQIYWEGGSTGWMREIIWGVADRLDYSEYFIPQVDYHLIDDHRPFLDRGIPAVDIIDFHYPYWHTTEDTCDKLSVDSLTRVGRVVEVTLEQRRLDGARSMLHLDESSRGFLFEPYP